MATKPSKKKKQQSSGGGGIVTVLGGLFVLVLLVGGLVGVGYLYTQRKAEVVATTDGDAQQFPATPDDGAIAFVPVAAWTENGSVAAAPRWSPDGRLVGFQVPRAFGTVKALVVEVQDDGRTLSTPVAPEGSDEKRFRLMERPVIGNGALVFEGQIERSPVRRLFFWTLGDDDATELVDVEQVPGDLIDAAIEPAGTQVALIQRSLTTADLWIWDRNSKKGRKIPIDGNDSQPAWSPDGAWLVVVREVDDDRDLVRVDLQKGRATELVVGPGDQSHPVVLPDGRVVYLNTADGRKFDVAIAETKGSRVLASGIVNPQNGSLGVSPDGKWLAYVETAAPDVIKVVAIDGGGPVALRPGIAPVIEPQLALKGGRTRIAFLGGDERNRGVYVADLTDVLAVVPTAPTAQADGTTLK